MKTIYFAGGCFWGMEAFMKKLPGVAETTAGYANGRTENPTYQEVCSNTTGHAETVKVVYDPEQIESCRAVIVGEGHYDWCVVIEAVVNFLMRHPELPLIAPNPDTHWPNGHGGIGIGAGATSRFIAEFLADL